jgi:hypothetical protein
MAVASNPVVVTKNSHPVLTFLGGAVVVAVVLAAIGNAVESREGAAKGGPKRVAAAARFVVADVLMDENCTQLGDYCVNAHCTFQNVGNLAGAKRVRAELVTESGGHVATQHSTLTLLPGATQRVTFNFMEATLDGESYRVKCNVTDTPTPGGAA